MVKGVSKQVIVVHSPDKELFDQAIFILKDSAAAKGISDEELMKQAKLAIRSPQNPRYLRYYGPVWACAGAAAMALMWLASSIL